MTKKIGDDYKAPVSELSTPATFSVKIADELKNTDSSKERTYSVVRIHGEIRNMIEMTPWHEEEIQKRYDILKRVWDLEETEK